MTGCVSGRTILMASELSYIWTLRRGQGENPRHHWNRVGWKRMSYGHFLRDGEVNECGLVKALCKLPTLPGSLDDLGAFQANFGQTVAEPCPSVLCGVNNVARVLGKLDYTCREGLSWLTTQIHNESRGHSWQRPLTTLHVREKPHTELSAFFLHCVPAFWVNSFKWVPGIDFPAETCLVQSELCSYSLMASDQSEQLHNDQ